MPVSTRIPSRLTTLAIALLLMSTAPAALRAQTTLAASAPVSATSGPMYDELARLDSLMFASAFVSCDTEQRNALFTDDVEFYHDKSGFMPAEVVRAPITECPRDNGVTRQLVEGSLEVYPMSDYGAIQMGVHRFEERGASTSTIARFVHLWQKKDGVWKISRVLSFDHRSEDVAASEPGQ